MTETMSAAVAAEEPAVPRFLTEHASTRGLRRVTPLSRPPLTGHIGRSFEVAAERAPAQLISFDRPPDIEPDGATTRNFAAWFRLVEEAAGWLAELGVRPWDRVAIFKANHADILALCAAAARIGAIPAPMGMALQPEAVKPMLCRLDMPYLVTDSVRLASGGIDEEAVARLTRRTLCVDGGDRSDVVRLDDLRGAPTPPTQLRGDEEPVIIPHTSGTTGVPKLVIHSATSIHAQSHVEVDRWPIVALRKSDRVAFADPFFHTRVQTAIAVMATVTPRVLLLSDPSPAVVRRCLADFRPTVVETLPNIYLTWEQLARDPAGLFRDVRLFLNSFDAIHTRVIRTFLSASDRRLPVWMQSWSQSECGAIALRPYFRSTVRRVGQRPPPTQVIGWPQPFIGKLRAVDPANGRELPAGEEGLIEISLPGRCLGYVGEQDRHAAKVHGEWWNTGDLGILRPSGSVRLLDREVDRIPGASCIEIEDVLLDRLPQLTEIIVLSVPDSLPAPVVSTAGDAPIAAEDWATAAADLPPMQAPVKVGWDEFPRTSTWKVNRNQLRARLFDAEPVGEGSWT
jgi:acyl-coenzyme A synthetase/AMP-(fatty) acid ligase